MPKRKSGTAASTSRNSQAAQSTLSFNSKSARVTKPSATSPSTSKASTKKVSVLEQDLDNEEVQTTSITPDPEPASPSIPIRSQPQTASLAKDEAQQKADKVTDAQIRKYWQAEEATRLAPRVHQKDLSTHEKILRHFDLSSQYGPCIGTPRLKRWRRAEGLGLKPPIEVLAVLLREEKSGKGKMAYIDELAGARVVLVE